MSDVAKKKETKEKKEFPTLNTIDDIIGHYQGFKEKEFKERIGAFEDFNHPENIHRAQLANHAQYAFFGRESNRENFPGAFNVAEKTLAGHYGEDNAKVTDEDKLVEILEKYTDSFLETVMGKGKLEKAVEQYKDEFTGDEEDLVKSVREFKGTLMEGYTRDAEGNGVNLLVDTLIKSLKGKKRIEIEQYLRGRSQEAQGNYAGFLIGKATKDLIVEDDREEIAKYITPIFKERGLTHDEPHITRNAQVQSAHYSLLLRGDTKTLQERRVGYKPLGHEPKDKKH